MKVVFVSRPGYRSVELKSGIRFVNCLDHQFLSFNFQISNALKFILIDPDHLMSVSRCGSITVDLALVFNSTTREQDVIRFLWNAAKDGKLGQFDVSAIHRTRSLVDFEIGTTAAAGTVISPGSKFC